MNQVVTTRNARFQQWQSYLTNRAKRTRAGEFVVQGVRPITVALDQSWPLDVVLYRRQDAPLSAWARGVLDAAEVPLVGVAPELMAELGDKPEQPPEVLAIARTRWESLDRWGPEDPNAVVVVLDRPASPGNVGTLIRSADAFGAAAVVVCGHGADPFDPRAVRASTGSVFSVPLLAAPGPADVLAAVARSGDRGPVPTVVGTDETGTLPVFEHDFTGATVLVVGNETRGMSAAWSRACDVVVSIPIGGAASSLGAPSAGAIALYEIARQRAGGGRASGPRP